MGKARIATGALLVTLVTAAMGYAIASAVLTYQDLGFGAEIDFAYIAQNYASILDQRPQDAQLVHLIIGGFAAAGLMLSLALSGSALTRFGQTHWQSAREMKANGFFGAPGTGFILGKLGPPGSRAKLSINFMPNAVYEPKACIKASLAAAARSRFDPKRLMFEFTENERIVDAAHVQNIVASYRNMGFTVAIDDFGAGYAGLALLARFQPDVIKIDMELVRGIDSSAPRQAIVAGIVGICRQLGITVLAEGIETHAEAEMLRAAGIRLFQGYLFARPELESFRAPSEIAALAAAA